MSYFSLSSSSLSETCPSVKSPPSSLRYRSKPRTIAQQLSMLESTKSVSQSDPCSSQYSALLENLHQQEACPSSHSYCSSWENVCNWDVLWSMRLGNCQFILLDTADVIAMIMHLRQYAPQCDLDDSPTDDWSRLPGSDSAGRLLLWAEKSSPQKRERQWVSPTTHRCMFRWGPHKRSTID